MAQQQTEYVTIYHPSGATNIIRSDELPYYLSSFGSSWSLYPPGAKAAEQGQETTPEPKQFVTPDGEIMTATPGQQFSSVPRPPMGTPIKRDDKGRWSLVFFSSDPTPEDPTTGRSYWLFDSYDKSYRPIQDFTQLDAFVRAHGGSSGQDALKLAIELDPASVSDPSLGWQGTFLGVNFAPKEDGSLPFYNNPNVVSDAITKKYGATARNIDEETSQAQKILDLASAMVVSGSLSQESFNALNDPSGTLLAKYTAAAVYGGYDFGEIWQDLRIRELAAEDPSYTGIRAVDDVLKRNEYRNTEDYKSVLNDPKLQKPIESIANGAYFMNTPLGRIDSSFFKELVPTVDWSDPKYKEQLDQIQAAWYDLALAQNQADTEQAKAVADANFNEFIRDINKKYGLNLSNNARTAWGQLQQIAGQAESRGIAGSGIQREAQDRMLADIRRSDQLLREGKITEEESRYRDYLLNYASDQQIADAVAQMDAEDRANGIESDKYRSRLWGLIPSKETLDFFDKEAMKKRFPGLSDEEVDLLRGSMVDKNGRYRSNLYRKALSSELDTRRNKETFQQSELLNRKMAEQERARMQFEPSLGSYTPPEKLTDIQKKELETPPNPSEAATQAASKLGTAPPKEELPDIYGGVTFRTGLNEDMIQKLKLAGQRLASTPFDQWEKTRAEDLANWRYGTNNSYIPKRETSGEVIEYDPKTGSIRRKKS